MTHEHLTYEQNWNTHIHECWKYKWNKVCNSHKKETGISGEFQTGELRKVFLKEVDSANEKKALGEERACWNRGSRKEL